MKKVAFYTLGCKVNRYDTESMMKIFEDNGYQIVDFREIADVYVINTCTVTHQGARKSRKLARRAKRRNQDSVVAVVGCYPQVSPGEVMEIEGVDLIVGTKSREELVQMVKEASRSNDTLNRVGQMDEGEVFEELPVDEFKGRTRGVIKVEEGCDQYCSYCIIPYARGPVRSRRPGKAVNEIKKLVNAGVKEIVLTGIHLGAYGEDLGQEMNLVELIKMLIPIDGLERIRLSSIEATEVDQEMIQLLADEPKVCPHLHLPLQSGSDSVLKSMNRPYNTKGYQKKIEEIRDKVPGIAITTDVMVGFPGETEEHFEETYNFIKDIEFSQLHVFKYSKRTGTPAAEMDEQVSPQTKNSRSEKLRELGGRLTKEYYQSFVGQTLEVLFEEEEDQSTGMLTGVTPNYIRVYLDSNDQELKGQTVHVKMVELYQNDGVIGQLVK